MSPGKYIYRQIKNCLKGVLRTGGREDLTNQDEIRARNPPGDQLCIVWYHLNATAIQHLNCQIIFNMPRFYVDYRACLRERPQSPLCFIHVFVYTRYIFLKHNLVRL